LIENISQNHPRALPVLFFTELWERFSYYGMQALLVLYMVSELAYSDSFSYGTFAAYAALVYITPIIGGTIADKLLGCRRAIILGGIIMALGHFALAFAGLEMFYLGLALLICGNGFFKPNISSLLGQLYTHGDHKRDAGFTIFYMGINIGAFFSPLVCGYLGTVYGWHYGFGMAGLGMLVGLVVFISFGSTLGNHGKAPKSVDLKKRVFGLTIPGRIYLSTVIAVPIFALMVYNASCLDMIMPVVGVLLIGIMVFITISSNSDERGNVMTICLLMIFHALFWAFMDQNASSLNLFTDRNVDRIVMGFEIPTPWFQALNPVFIVMLAPIISFLWVRLSYKNMDPNPPFKFALGILLLAAGFGMLSLEIYFADAKGISNVYWLVAAYFLMTAGEVCISPVGLSMVTRLAPRRYASFFMGAWLISISYAHYLGGIIAKLTSVAPDENGKIDTLSSSQLYGEVFTDIAYCAFAVSIVMFVISPMLRGVFDREDHQSNDEDNDEDESEEDSSKEASSLIGQAC